MLITWTFLIVASLVDLAFLYRSWIVPAIARNSPVEPGRDDEVSTREMRRRSAWRYDDWVSRIMGLVLFIMLVGFWIVALISK